MSKRQDIEKEKYARFVLLIERARWGSFFKKLSSIYQLMATKKTVPSALLLELAEYVTLEGVLKFQKVSAEVNKSFEFLSEHFAKYPDYELPKKVIPNNKSKLGFVFSLNLEHIMRKAIIDFYTAQEKDEALNDKSEAIRYFYNHIKEPVKELNKYKVFVIVGALTWAMGFKFAVTSKISKSPSNADMYKAVEPVLKKVLQKETKTP